MRLSVWLSAALAVVITLSLVSLPHAGSADVASDDAETPLPADFKLSDYEGKVVVVEVMQTWCEGCKHAVRRMNRWVRDHGDEGLAVVAVSDEHPKRLARYKKFLKLAADIRRDPGFEWARSTRKTKGYPSFLLFDRDGKYVSRVIGAGSRLVRLERRFKKLLAAGKGDGMTVD